MRKFHIALFYHSILKRRIYSLMPKQVLKLLQDTSRETGMTVIIITHNSALTAMADRVISVKNGTVVSQQKNEKATPVEEIEW